MQKHAGVFAIAAVAVSSAFATAAGSRDAGELTVAHQKLALTAPTRPALPCMAV